VNYHIRVYQDPQAVDAAEWNALLKRQSAPTVFMRHEYLAAMHQSGSAVPATGWTPRFVTLEHEGRMEAAAALYLKAHSYGEYVFDWAWADAYRRHGQRYYPKLLGAAPFTPVPGSRLLASTPEWRQRLAQVVGEITRGEAYSSAHWLFLDEHDASTLQAQGWMLRHGVQFHWQADAHKPAVSFDEFLATLQREKRKKIAQERRRVAEQGVHFTVHEGAQIDAGLWDFFYHCYTLTYQAHGSSKPYLQRSFFEQVASSLTPNWLMFVAWQGGERIACSMLVIDPAQRVAYGRYWGATRQVSCLHFEACYYQPLAWCITNGYQRFEGGAQGEHKMARGLLPVRTTSAHWLRDERFASAVADFLAREGAGIEEYVDELRERNPFKGA
jgi:uncharacterized protein